MALTARTPLVVALAAWSILVGREAGAQNKPDTSDRPAQAAASPGKSGGISADEYKFEDLQAQLLEGKMTRLEQILVQIPEKIRASFVLMAKSNSSHQASREHPRVILCSPNAKLIVGYSTFHNDENRDMLEIIQWRDETKTFEFREIAFDPRGKKPPIISKANPSHCAGCHGDSLRPNWEPASIWPGAIGSAARFEPVEAGRLALLSKRIEPRLAPRLQALVWTPASEGTETPASKMAHHINKLNTHRMTRFFRESKDYDLYKYALVAGLLARPDFLQIEPVRTASLERPTEYSKMLEETRTELGDFLGRPAGWGGVQFDPVGDAITNVRFIFEPRKMSLRDVTTSIRSPFLLAGNLDELREVVDQLYQEDADLQEQAPLRNAQDLKAAAQKAWERHTGIPAPR